MIDFFNTYFNDIPVITTGIDYGFYEYCSYSKGTYLDDYKLMNSDFFSSIDNIDSMLFYNERFTVKTGGWKTNKSMEEYSKAISMYKDVYTLSDSNFLPFIRINSLKEIKMKLFKTQILEFHKPKIIKENFVSFIKKSIFDNLNILNSYFLSIKKYPEKKIIDKIIDKISRILTN